MDTNSIADLMRSPLNPHQTAAINDDFEGRLVSREELLDTCEDGWQFGNLLKQEAKVFSRMHLSPSPFLTPLSDSEFHGYRRGEIGNSGCTGLLFLKHGNPFLNTEKQLLAGHLMPGLNNAKHDAVEVGEGESLFVNVSEMADNEIHELVRKYLNDNKGKSKRQRKDSKTEDDCIKILRKESQHLHPAHSVMLPRSLRATGRVFVATKPTFVSTNFFVIPTKDAESAKILSSWLSSVFYLLECEAFGNNRKGLRKMEKVDYELLHVPVLSALSDEQKTSIIKTSFDNFLDLRNPTPREIDRVWAQILFDDHTDEFLNSACSLLAQLVAMRER